MKYATLFALAAASCVYTIDFEERAFEWTVGQRVNTTSGAVLGHPATNDLEVSEYLGIPYGKAPIGELRFAAPVRFNGTVNLDGSAFKASCPVRPGSSSSSVYTVAQLAAANVTSVGIQALAIFSDTGANYSEDCLYVNVWTKPQTGDATKAVLVWIHGGAFSSGSSTIPAYNGANLAGQEGVVVVSFNYRLSILGFPGNPSGPNNLGLLDQRLAVEWVRDNIANFGGDPSRITIFGQSAGGASVDFYSYAWNSDPIAAGFIPESGNVFSWGLPSPKKTSAENWFNVTSTLGCGDASSDSAVVLSCMRKQNYNAILAAMPTSSGLVLGGFIPTVDETVVFSNYSQRTPAKVPMLIGNNDYEGGLFRTSYALQGIFLPDIFWDNFNLQEYTCPCGIRANASASANNPTWRYRYYGVFPNLAISSEAGAYHEAEIPLIFNTAPSNPASSEAEISTGNYMRGAWAAFAKDPANGLTALGWPTYNPNSDTLIRLAYGNTTGPNVTSPYYTDSNCVLVNASSTNVSDNPTLSATVSSSPTSSATATGSSTAATTSKGEGGKVEIGVWVGFGALIMGFLL